MGLQVREKQKVSKLLVKLLVGRSQSLTAMKVWIIKLWEEYLLVWLNVVLGVASMNLTDYQKNNYQPFPNRFK